MSYSSWSKLKCHLFNSHVEPVEVLDDDFNVIHRYCPRCKLPFVLDPID